MVATPIGNLDDITLRALKILESVSVIACEDTRHTGQLLAHYNIKKRCIACHAHNESESAKGIIALMDSGQDVAYCSDQSGHTVVPVPGASAFVTLLSAAGNVGKTFTFEGFLSPKKGRRTRRLEELVSRGESFIIYESPFRILKTLEDVRSTDPSCRVVVGRELTKQFEEIFSSDISSAIETLMAKPSIKGEFAVVVIPSGGACDNAEEDQDS